MALYGVGVLLAAGVVFEALPRVSGREPATLDRPRSFNRWTVVGVAGVTVSMIGAGLVSGYSWVAGVEQRGLRERRRRGAPEQGLPKS